MEMNVKGKKNIIQHFGKILRIWLFSIRHRGVAIESQSSVKI